jgi:hypothetical protein
MYRGMVRTLGVILTGIALVLGFVGTASAAPAQKGHSEVESGLLNLAEAFNILRVEAVAPSIRTGNVYSLPVVGNWETGTVKMVGGQSVTHVASGEQMTITNLWQENDNGIVTGVVNDGERMTLFTIQPTSATTANLRFTAESAAMFNDFVGIPLLTEGSVFGTAKLTLTWPGK